MLHCKRPVFYLGWAIIIASLTACANSPIGKNWEQSLAPDPQLTDNPTVFRDYQFTANDLEEFHGFQIKIIMTGTKQAYVPRIKDLRAIALA